MPTLEKDILLGRSLEGRYRILERIARGGMSTVYAAVDERLDRLVAVKVMSGALSADPAFTDRFAREARAAARLSHLNAVSVYDQGHDVGPDGHHVFLVMELVEGRTVRELLRERGRLSSAQAVSLMEPVLSALAAAHRAGLVHRDIKPENILLSDEGVVKVADFGLARAIESETSATRTGMMMGTVAYCSPEQVTSGRADPRSDVYSAGIVLFELLTGAPPYHGDSAMQIAYQHVHARVPAPSSRIRPDTGIANEIDELVIAATDSDAASRPADAGAFLAELADVRVALALAVTPVPPRVRPIGGVRRRAAGGPDDQLTEPGTLTAAQHGTHPSGPTTALGGALAGTGPGGQRHDTMIDTRGTRAPARGGAGGADRSPPPPVVIPPPRERPAHRRRRALLGLLLVLALGTGAGYGAWYFAAGRYATVPRESGVTPAAARADLIAAGFRVEQLPGPEYDETVRKGTVLRTSPGADARVVRGRTVTIVVSAGPHYYPVKAVRGMSPDQARSTLLTAGPAGSIVVAQNVRPEYSDTIAINTVTRTSPAAGQQVHAGQAITIFVSQGPPLVTVPKVTSSTSQDDATALLHKAQFHVKIEQTYSDTVGTGNVVSLDHTGKAVKFSTITVTVSLGPELVNVPNITRNEPLEQARQQIIDAGLVPDSRIFGGGDGTGAQVIYTVPASGQPLHVGGTVVVYAI